MNDKGNVMKPIIKLTSFKSKFSCPQPIITENQYSY